MTGGELLSTLEFSDGGVRFVIFFATLLPALIMASRKSTYLVDYYIVVVCLNRFVRRVLDWSDGEYDPRPISSLLPLLIAGLMLAVTAWQLPQLPRRYRHAFFLLGGGLAYGAVVGVVHGMAMFYALLEYIAPMGLLFYGLAIRADLAALDRWINTMTRCAVGVAVYGWYQWTEFPPWDAQWIEWSGMWTSMGHPEPFKTSICSTLESRGPLAWFMAMAAVPMLVNSRWRRGVGWPGALVVVSAILPSTVRSAWGILVVGMACFAMIRGGQSWPRIAFGFAVAVAGLLLVKSQLPQSEHLFSRVESIANLSADRSFQGRARIAQEGLGIVLGSPQGYGLGSSGLAGKISGEAGVIGDNGLLELLATFGLPGVILIAMGMRWFVRDAIDYRRRMRSEHAALGIAQLASGMSALAFANWFAGSYSGMALMILGVVASRTCGRYAPLPSCRAQPHGAVRWA